MKKITQLLVLSLLLFNLFSCDKDDFDSNPTNDPNLNSNDLLFQSENFGEVTTGSFFGVIKDEDGLLLEDVQINVGNAITFTDRNGVFTINDVEVFENFAYVKANKSGYINGSRVVIPKSEGSNRIDIVLYKNETDAVINTGQNTSVNISGGLKINFIGGDFIGEDGELYNGPVEIVANYLRPNGIDTFTNMPGSLFAQTESNDAVNLQTYGMVSVNLFSPSGEELNIAENSPVTIEYPIHFSQVDSAPETIDLWYFDDEVGYWKEEGQATKVDDKYIADVEHFTWWNIDVPFDPINFCFTINSAISDGSTPYYTRITRSNNQVIYSNNLISDGAPECGVVPADEPLIFSIYTIGGTCGYQLIYQQNIGPFSSDSDIDITFSDSEEQEIPTTPITGTVNNCNGAPLSNGYVYVDNDNIFNITNGIIDIAIPYCSETTTILQIYDNDTGQWTLIYDVPLNGNEFNVGAISTCGESGGIFNGDLTISSQNQLEEFGALGYTTFIGNLRIGGYQNGSDINSLLPLINLESVIGILEISHNDSLLSLNGLNNLEISSLGIRIRSNPSLTEITSLSNLVSIGDLSITNNSSLASLDGLESLSSINQLSLSSNAELSSINGLTSLTSLYYLNINNCPNLTSIAPFSNLESLNIVWLYQLDGLTSLEGIHQLTNIDFIRISDIDALTDLSDLSNLTAVNILNIAGNDGLLSLDGLENLISASGIIIGVDIQTDVFVDFPNPNLTDFCALENLFINGTYIESPTNLQFPIDGVTIENNAYNPTVQDIINGNCSQ